MNFIAGISLIMNNMEEEDAFYLLCIVVEDFCAGLYSKAMINIQIDSFVLSELLSEKMPELNKHMEAKYISTLLVATKWFMCLFVGALPSEVFILYLYLFKTIFIYLFFNYRQHFVYGIIYFSTELKLLLQQLCPF